MYKTSNSFSLRNYEIQEIIDERTYEFESPALTDAEGLLAHASLDMISISPPNVGWPSISIAPSSSSGLLSCSKFC